MHHQYWPFNAVICYFRWFGTFETETAQCAFDIWWLSTFGAQIDKLYS